MKIKLLDWAKRRYDPIPPKFTLRRWAREGEIHPQPELVGKEYYVEERAERFAPTGGPSLLDRVRQSA